VLFVRKNNLSCIASSMIAPIACWSVCEPAVLSDGSLSSPDVSFIEPMQRRRLSTLARMTLRVAYDCAHDFPEARFVFASRHGELIRTTRMLENIAGKEILSPTVFSMSVLNAGTGLFSMLQKNEAPASAISAGCSSFGYGLLEACLQLAANPEQPVLFVYADEPAPVVYGEVDAEGCAAHAVGLLLQSSAKLRMRGSILPEDGVSSREVQSRAFLRCLEQGGADWHDSGKTWRWVRD
jgi:hypothetical protein